MQCNIARPCAAAPVQSTPVLTAGRYLYPTTKTPVQWTTPGVRARRASSLRRLRSAHANPVVGSWECTTAPTPALAGFSWNGGRMRSTVVQNSSGRVSGCVYYEGEISVRVGGIQRWRLPTARLKCESEELDFTAPVCEICLIRCRCSIAVL
jgi:hypothetical protein